MSDQYKITDEQKNLLLQISAQTLPDNPSRDGYSADAIRKRLYKPFDALVDLVNSVFGSAYADVTELQDAVASGDLFARAMVQWSAAYTYGANEITYYPVGTYGAFVKSVVANNIGQTPYVDGAVNSAYWAEVLNFDNAYAAMQASVDAAQEAASHAENQADAAAQSASDAEQSVGQAEFYAGDASASAANALASETAAGESATAAAGSAGEAADSASDAEQSAENAAASAELARKYAELGIQPNTDYTSVDDLPKPGSTKFIYLIPAEGAGSTGDDVYDEYIWVPDKNDYEHIGSTRIDLSNYAQINGNYQGMTVGAATKATQDGAGNVISDTYAKKNDIGLVQQIDEPLPVPTEENPYVIYDGADLSAYVRKVYQTQENTIYPPSPECLYYYIIDTKSDYTIGWRTSILTSVGFSTPNVGSKYGYVNVQYYSRGYSNVEEATAALKNKHTSYTEGPSNITYWSGTGSSGHPSVPITNTNQTEAISYVTYYYWTKPSGTSGWYAKDRTSATFDPVDGYVDGTAPQNQYVKIIDADDAQNYATKEEVEAKYTKPSTGIPKTDLASAVQTSLNKADTALQSVPLATSSAVGGVKPVAKTDDMTQSVGVDANGALFTAPSGGGSIEYMTDDEVDALFEQPDTYKIINNASSYVSNITVNDKSKTTFKKGDVIKIYWNDSSASYAPKINGTSYRDNSTYDISIIDSDITIDSTIGRAYYDITITISTA